MVAACSAEDIWTPSESKADHIVRTTLLLRKIILPTGYVQGASCVAGIAGSSSHADRDLHYRADDLGVLAYAETAVSTPQHTFAEALQQLPSGVSKAVDDTLKSHERRSLRKRNSASIKKRRNARMRPCSASGIDSDPF
jgi:hypothetical protein